MMKLLILTRYAYGGSSSRYRFYQYLSYLEDNGFEVTIQPLFDDSHITSITNNQKASILAIAMSYFRRVSVLLSSRGYDLIFLEKEILPWIPYALESFLLNSSIPCVIDYDDATFHSYELHTNEWVKKILGRKIDMVMKNSSRVIAGNSYLADRAIKAGATQVSIVPTVIDIKKYLICDHQINDAYTVGWIGSSTTTRYLQTLSSVFFDISTKDDTKIAAIGAKYFQIEGVDIEIKSWTEESEIADLQRIDVGIMPLDDSPWSRGKCGFKLIQYMACSKAVVASPVGVNSSIVEHGVNGFLASTNEEWVRYLQILRHDKELRIKMGQQGRKKVEKEFSLQITAPRLVEILKSSVLT